MRVYKFVVVTLVLMHEYSSCTVTIDECVEPIAEMPSPGCELAISITNPSLLAK